MKRLGDMEDGGAAYDEAEKVVEKLAADLPLPAIAGLVKGERVNAEVHRVGGMVGHPNLHSRPHVAGLSAPAACETDE